MDNIKSFFSEFRSIFITNDLLKENEEHANIVTASTMHIVFLICSLVWVLTFFDIFKIGMETINAIMIRGFLLLAIPGVICLVNKGRGKYMKHYLFVSFSLMLAMADAMLKYNVTLVMVFPIILSARYYDKKLVSFVAKVTVLAFIISAFMSTRIGQQDINTYNLIIPKGTTITIDGTLRDAITQLEIDETQRAKNVFVHFFLPKLLLYSVVSFACIQIAQSGKSMVNKQKEITERGKRIETELNLASIIQKNMLPSIFPPFPEHEEIDIYASMKPAKEVGGDFYDMFLIDDNHLAICMADVSGKGVPASLFMMITKILIKNVTSIEDEVDKAFYRVNNMLCDGNKIGIFVTCWFGIVDLRNGKVEFVNAGHNPPLLYSSKVGKYEYLKTKPNLVLAGMENTKYKKNEMQIEPGDRIFLYTDGVVEATDSNNNLYGEQRLKDFLNSHITESAEGIINKLKTDIDEFTGDVEQFDDITLLDLVYIKKKENGIQRVFKANQYELPKVQEFVEKELSKVNCDMKTLYQIDLVIEEVFINIANYAYGDKEGDCKLSIDFEGKDRVRLIFQDSGIPFNPLEKNDPDVSLSAEDREVGGLGIFITKKIMDDISYKYENGKNILVITKNLL